MAETYNPWSVVNAVFHHLVDAGLHPVLGETGDPSEPAAALLTALGIEPHHPTESGYLACGVERREARRTTRGTTGGRLSVLPRSVPRPQQPSAERGVALDTHPHRPGEP